MALLLRLWLLGVTGFRCFSVYLGYANQHLMREKLFSHIPHEANDFTLRLFGVWTALSGLLTLMCAIDLHNFSMFTSTFLSFAVALAFFGTEMVHFQTMVLHDLIPPYAVAGASMVFMAIYYMRNRSKFGGGSSTREKSLLLPTTSGRQRMKGA